MCCLFLPQTIGCYWLLQRSNLVALGSYSDQTSFQSSFLFLWALGKHFLLTCCHPHSVALSLYIMSLAQTRKSAWYLSGSVSIRPYVSKKYFCSITCIYPVFQHVRGTLDEWICNLKKIFKLKELRMDTFSRARRDPPIKIWDSRKFR